MSKNIIGEIADFVCNLHISRIPADIVDYAKTCLLHNLGVTLAARDVEAYPQKYAARWLVAPEEATSLMDGRRLSGEGAVFANAALMHARTQDDYHVPTSSHLGASVVPAILAVAEIEGSTGREFLEALVAGYEVAARVGRDHDHLSTARGFRPTSTYGVFGSAAGCARQMKLPRAETANALGFAAHFACGLAQTWAEGTPEWRIHTALSARNGLVAARLSATGGASAPHILEGVSGFYKAFAGNAEYDVAHLRDLGSVWEIMNVTTKRLPICAILQTPTRNIIELSRRHDLAADRIASVRIELSQFEATYPGIDNKGPYHAHSATLMSAQYCAAVALLDGTVTFPALMRFGDERIGDMARRVDVAANPDMAVQASSVAITTTDGRILTAEGRFEDGSNKPDLAATAALVRDLAEEMGEDPGRARVLIDAVAELETAPDVGALLAPFVDR